MIFKTITKGTMKYLYVAFFLSILTCARAQSLAPVALTATAMIQTTAVVTGTKAKYPPLTKYSITTKSLLVRIAQTEFMLGSYFQNQFPVGAKLVVNQAFIIGVPSFGVLDKGNNLLVNCDNLMSSNMTATLNSISNFAVISGAYDTGTSLSSPSRTRYAITYFKYDDTTVFLPTSLKFTMSGMLTTTQSDTAPNPNTGIYRESVSSRATNMTGPGQYLGSSMVVTGSLSYASTIMAP